MKIDLNSDMAEGFGAYRMADDETLLDIVSSANLACGFHAGDAVIMDRTVRMARDRGVAIGAHIGYPDLMGFGRRPMAVEPAEMEKHAIYQLGALQGIARAAGCAMSHASFHGSLGNLVAVDRPMAEAMASAVRSFDPALFVSSAPGTAIAQAAEAAGLRVVTKFLADRAYDAQGLLVSRKLPNAMIKDPAAVRERVMRLLTEGTVIAATGETLRMTVHSILIHSDTAGAVALARVIRKAVEDAGGTVAPFPQTLG
ncbi:MAG TPA: 5-oxoprolinase subunit PxpA [Roseomonas sp.]